MSYITDLISIIIPIYNVEKYITRCVASILNQSYTNFELLLVDDGSKDNSLTIIKDFENRDKRIKVIALPENIGNALAKEQGYREAKGEYIHFLDSDDFIARDFLKLGIEKIKEISSQKNQLLPLIYNSHVVYEYETNAVKKQHKKVDNHYKKDGFYKPHQIKNCPNWLYLYRHSYLDTCIPFYIKEVPRVNDDIYFGKVVCEPLEQIYSYFGAPYHYFIRDNGNLSMETHQYSYKKDMSFLAIMQNTYLYYKSKNLLDKCSIFSNFDLIMELEQYLYKQEYWEKLRETFNDKNLVELILKSKLYTQEQKKFVRDVIACEKYENYKILKQTEKWEHFYFNSSLLTISKDSKNMRIKLFGIIPIFKSYKKNNIIKMKMFGIIPIGSLCGDYYKKVDF